MHYFDFHYSWEQRKVREVTDRYDNLRIPVAASLRVAGTTPYYGANGIQDYVDGYTHDGEFILVAEDGANDLKNYPVKCVKGRIWVNNHAHVLQGKYDCADNQFLAYAISQADIESLLVGGGRAKLNAETLMGIDLLLPNKAEQIRIGKYLAQLDNLITLHQRKYDKLTNVKKSMLEKMFPQNGSNVPEIRFKGFTEAWEQRKFGEVFDCTVPNNTLSRAELSYDEGTVLNVHYGDVLIKYGSVLDVQKDDIPRIPHRCREDFNGALLQDGDVIIADTAEDETTGKACEIGNLQGSAIVSGLHTMVCRPRNRMALGYLGYYLNSNAYHHQLLPLMQGIKVLSLSRSNIQKTSVSYPSAMKEQQLIASYFSQLDHLITLHQREFAFLCKEKSKKFRYIKNAWEQRKVTEIGKIYIGLVTTMTKHYTDEGTLLIRNSDIKDGKFEFGDNPIYLEKTFAEKNETRMHQIGDVITVHTGDVGTSAVITENEAKSIGFATIVTRPNPKIIDSNYLCSFLNTDKHKKWAVSISTGDGRTNYNLGDYFELVVPVPSIAEQKKIASYIQKLNRLITLHQRKPNFYTGGYYAE